MGKSVFCFFPQDKWSILDENLTKKIENLTKKWLHLEVPIKKNTYNIHDGKFDIVPEKPYTDTNDELIGYYEVMKWTFCTCYKIYIWCSAVLRLILQ